MLNLTDTLARHVEHATQLVQGARLLATKAVAQLKHTALTVGELVEQVTERFVAQCGLGGHLRSDGVLIGEEADELGFLVLTNRLLERNDRLRATKDVLNLLRRQAGGLTEFFHRGLAAELADEHALGAADLVELFHDVNRDADGATLVGQSARHGLTDPPCRIGRKLEATTPVELLDCANQAQRALLNKVEKGETAPAIGLRDGHHKTEVGLNHAPFRIGVAGFDALCQAHFLGCGEQRNPSNVLEEQLEGIGGLLNSRVMTAVAFGFVELGGPSARLDGVDDVDPDLVEVLVQLRLRRCVDVEAIERLTDFVDTEEAQLLPPRNQRLKLAFVDQLLESRGIRPLIEFRSCPCILLIVGRPPVCRSPSEWHLAGNRRSVDRIGPFVKAWNTMNPVFLRVETEPGFREALPITLVTLRNSTLAGLGEHRWRRHEINERRADQPAG